MNFYKHTPTYCKCKRKIQMKQVPVILVTQEAEIRRIEVPNHPGKEF
jgi:hypothetical protein